MLARKNHPKFAPARSAPRSDAGVAIRQPSDGLVGVKTERAPWRVKYPEVTHGLGFLARVATSQLAFDRLERAPSDSEVFA